MGGSGESGTLGGEAVGKSPGGIIARKQRARYNAANGGIQEKSSSCPREGFASRPCARGGESRLGLPGHAQACAARQRRAEAGAREREEIHPGADRRRLQSARLVSRRASADAGDRRDREKAGARVRALPSSDG